MRVIGACVLVMAMSACGDNAECNLYPFEDGDPVGNLRPLAAGPNEARAGRLVAEQIPDVDSGLITWAEGDYVLANDRVALVIEAVGASNLYDPWGGRPVGVARIDAHRLVEPANFGELFLLTGRSTVVTEEVSVIDDGSDGSAAVIRARGKLHPLPFFESLTSVAFADPLTDIEAAIDYSLAPGADHVDVVFRYYSPRTESTDVRATLHAFMYTKRMPLFQPGRGFDEQLDDAPYAVFVDDSPGDPNIEGGATSWAYLPGEGTLGSPIAASGFVGSFGPGLSIPPCQRIGRLHARIAIGAGLDGARVAAENVIGTPLREITGDVMRMGVGLSYAHVHARAADGTYITRATADDTGHFSIHVPVDADVTLDGFRRGGAIGSVHVGTASDPVTIEMPSVGTIVVSIDDGTDRIPGRIQVVPVSPTARTNVPEYWGEDAVETERERVVYSVGGGATIIVPPGDWEVIVSRGYEYEVDRRIVTVPAGGSVTVDASLEHVVATPSMQCADFHIHTWRSNDSGDRAVEKIAQAIADGLELPVRSDHEWVADFTEEIALVGGERYARGFGSVELTSFELWGHMGVFPLVPDATVVNAGAPVWQTFPTADSPDTPFATLSPRAVFETVRARPEAPVVIINHPRGPTNYFGYVGFDPVTGIATNTADWDTKFTLVEVFNDSGWQANKDGTVADWFALLRAGRKVFAVGSSDSHGIASSPVGYPRTCLALGTDDPQALSAEHVRDTLAGGHAVVSGGIYPSARIGTAGPGDTVTGAGSPMMVDVEIQAASWIDVDAIDVVVDGVVVDTIAVVPGDAVPGNPAIRWRGQIPVQSAATGGFVVIAAYAERALQPVHPGRIPFGVTNPIFVSP